MTKRDRIFGGIEYFLAAMFLYGGVNSFFAHPIDTPSVFYDLLAGQVAIYIYAVFFFLTGLFLLLSKLRKWKKVHGHMLMVMYLTCMYVLILTWVVVGPSLDMALNVSIGILAALCWLRWRIKTAYINPNDFNGNSGHFFDDVLE